MREPKYLSPSGLNCWLKDRDEYYRRYLADTRWPRDPQTKPMAAGSAFDAFVKARIYKDLGLGVDASMELDALMTAQVDPELRDWGWDVGRELFDWYVSVGGLADVMLLCAGASDVRMEFEVRGLVTGPSESKAIGSVTLMGKPDLVVYRGEGRPVILDWKVNGYCSSRKPSPRRGYVNTRPGGRSHRDAVVGVDSGGDMRNLAQGIDGDWGRQLAIYSWVMGAAVGEEWFCCIDQLCLGPDRDRWELAQHRGVVLAGEQHATWAACVECWDRGWVADGDYGRLDSGPMEIGEGMPDWLTQ
jgi:hypothetical protein